jgi:chemotaxis protein MotB
MAGQGNAAPVIIKRKKVIQGGGHHGGAWKVAYADFVTAMMAFFMLMWLLNATTEKQRKGIADYFNPTIAVSRVSGGGDGMFGGDSTFTQEELAKNGSGGSSDEMRAQTPDVEAAAKAAAQAAAKAAAKATEEQDLSKIESALSGRGGESMAMQRLLKHVVTKLTDEGLVFEFFDLPDEPLFAEGSTDPQGQTLKVVSLLAGVLDLAENQIAVNGYVRTLPITLKNNPSWELSTARAQAIRQMLEGDKIPATRIDRISGHADRKPATRDPTAVRNNRIEVILLRRFR